MLSSSKTMVSIITVNYKTQKYLSKLLDSIQENVKQDIEHIIVDNNSGDNLDELATKYPFVKVIYNQHNSGFGGGINLGAKEAKGEYLYFLNPDTYLLSDVVKTQKEILDANPKSAMVGGNMTKSDGTSQDYQYGSEPTLIDTFLMSKKHEQLQMTNDKVQQVDWVSGGAMMMKAKVFEEVKGFDERFFMYFEDIDISKRIQQAGYEIYWTPDAKLFHVEGGAEAVYKKTKKRYYQSQRKYFAKHTGAFASWLLWPLHQLLLTRYK